MPIDLPGPPVVEGPDYRWLQLAMGIVCMAMIANLQYGWTLFVDPIDAKYHWGRAAIQFKAAIWKPRRPTAGRVFPSSQREPNSGISIIASA